jgi:hypothetical protein
MYSRSAKGGEKGDPNRNPWLAKMERRSCTALLMWNINGRQTTDYGRQVMTKTDITFGKVG